MEAFVILVVSLATVTAVVFLLRRYLLPPPLERDAVSPVTRQHIDLFQGGHLNEDAVQSAKSRYRELLERGDVEAVENSLKPGTQFVVQVRALTEIGSDTVGRILERQLARRITDDQIEQSWYWIDVAASLRALNRDESLPHLLRCAEETSEAPLCHFFAVETVCFVSFRGYLRQLDTPTGRNALRQLHRALEGLRFGVPALLVVEARLGEAVEQLWDDLPGQCDPLIVMIALESVRLLRREEHWKHLFLNEKYDEEIFHWQMSRLTSIEPMLHEYLHDAPKWLRGQLAHAHGRDLRDALHALIALRADVGPEVTSLLRENRMPFKNLAVEALSWSKDPEMGTWLRQWVAKSVSQTVRAKLRRRPLPPKYPSLPAQVPYRAVLRAMRGYPSHETERFLLEAAKDYDPTFRAAAVSSFGWWDPVSHHDVHRCLQLCRCDPNADVRQAARAALARMGERQALLWFLQALRSEEFYRIHEAIFFIAHEQLTLLMPELDRLADSENTEIAYHAREAMEQMHEAMNPNQFFPA